MAGRKKKADQVTAADVVLTLARTADALFVHYTGKTIPEWLREFGQRPRVLPAGGPQGDRGGEGISQEILEPTMPLDWAYAVLGLKPDAPLEQVKKNYRNLARVFHTDKGGMNDEAMKILNRAYERITKGKG